MQSEEARSFPVRERGLKPVIIALNLLLSMSFPVRERGLKHIFSKLIIQIILVVPRAGTWIETDHLGNHPAPLSSFPVRERGLKRSCAGVSLRSLRVVPRAGTWIETRTPSLQL